VDLSKVKDREALSPRREPYWHRLRPGCFLGYRASVREGAGTWIARAYAEDARKYHLKALGDFGTLPSSERFAAAKRDAEAFYDHLEAGGEARPETETVKDACEAYAKDNPEAEGRFTRHVYSDPIANIALPKLRRRHTKEWRARLDEKPALVSRAKGGEQRTRARSKSSINRDQAALRAALGRHLAPGAPNSEAAWQEPLKPIKNATGRRTLYLAHDQRKKLVDALPAEAEPFIRALCLLPLRPGAMAALSAGDWERRTRELTIGKDKTGKPRRIIVPQSVAALLTEQAKGKLPGGPLFMRANGKRWDKETWNDPIAAAATEAKLPARVTAYTLRHSVITDLVNGGLALLTVAQISDTSVEMIERHYGHLDKAAAEKALARLAL